MTVIVGYHIPKIGAVISSDGQVTLGEYRSKTDFNKLICYDTFTVGMSGEIAIKKILDSYKFETFKELSDCLFEYSANSDLNYGILAYDARRDQLRTLHNGGADMHARQFAVVGSGSMFALGALEMIKRPKTIEQAIEATTAAVKVACKYDLSCSGRIRTVWTPRIRPRGKAA